MKKVLALLLTVVIVFACSLIPVSAENNKIQPKLQAVIENSNPEDIVSVYISFSGYMKRKDDMPSWPDKIKAAQEYKEYIAERNKTIFAQVFDGLDVEILCDVFGNMVIANVKVSDIETIAKNDIVQDIDYYEDLEPIPDEVDASKIQPKLQAVIENSNPEDIVSVYISFSGYMKRKDDMPSWPDKIKAAQEYKEYIAERNKTIFAQVFDGLDVEILCDIFGNMVIANVKVSDIETIAKYDIVQDIDYYDDLEPIPADDNYLYLDKLYKQYGQLPLKYDEVYYHTDETEEIDWALVYAYNGFGFEDVITDGVIGGRYIYLPSPEHPFTVRYAVYDVKEDHFYDLVDYDYLKPTDVFERYDGLYEVWQTLDLSEMSFEVICGDANGDRDVDIIDTTWIQRYLVSLVSKYDIAETAADVDGDGDVTIIDATRIQRALVGLCNLDGTPC